MKALKLLNALYKSELIKKIYNQRMEEIPQQSNRSKKKQQRKILTQEEKLEKLKEYEQSKSKYPKGQLCTFYLRGLCWMDNKCQFAHGVDDLNFENFMKFSKDRKEKKLINSDYVKAMQRNYLIHNSIRSYKNLFEFQEKNKNSSIHFPHFYTLEQLNSDARKRIEIRRIFHFHEFDKFCELIFKNFEILAIEEFETMLENTGFEYNYRYFGPKKLFSKSISEKSEVGGKAKKKSIIKLMPKEDEILKNFLEILLKKLKEDLTKGEEIFPLSYKYVNNIINKNSDFDTPLIHHYLKIKNKTANEFMEDLVQNESFVNRLKDILYEFGKDLVNYEGIIHKQDMNEIILEIKETFWEKFNNSEGDDEILKLFGFLKFDFIKENYFKKLLDDKNSYIQSEYNLTFAIKKTLTHSKNLFLMNNNSTMFIFHPNQFLCCEMDDYFQSKYERRCELEDSEIQMIVNKIIEKEENEGNFCVLGRIKEIFSEFQFDLESEIHNENFLELNSESESQIQSQTNLFKHKILAENNIILVDDLKSLLYFVKKIGKFKEISVDLEGKLNSTSSSNPLEVDLIQIKDSLCQEIFVIDVHKIFQIDKNPSTIKLLKIILTYLFETNTILKIFHDGRNDCTALHHYFKICTSNYIDTSCVFAAVKQINHQIEFHSKFLKKSKSENILNDSEFHLLYSNINNSINPGLNKVLENYETDKNVNHLKDKMQQLFGSEKSREEYFLKRPIDSDWLLYSALDVKYLYNAYLNMKKELEKSIKIYYGHIDNKVIEIFMRLISNEHMKMSCCREKLYN